MENRIICYCFRVGRSARSERFGSAITFVTQYELERLKDIEKHIKVQLEELPVDKKALAKDATTVFVLRRETEIKIGREWKQVEEKRRTHKRKELMMKGFDAETADEILDTKRKR
jgi:ATP-dependent RNA helicase DDX49/DBP8